MSYIHSGVYMQHYFRLMTVGDDPTLTSELFAATAQFPSSPCIVGRAFPIIIVTIFLLLLWAMTPHVPSPANTLRNRSTATTPREVADLNP